MSDVSESEFEGVRTKCGNTVRKLQFGQVFAIKINQNAQKFDRGVPFSLFDKLEICPISVKK